MEPPWPKNLQTRICGNLNPTAAAAGADFDATSRRTANSPALYICHMVLLHQHRFERTSCGGRSKPCPSAVVWYMRLFITQLSTPPWFRFDTGRTCVQSPKTTAARSKMNAKPLQRTHYYGAEWCRATAVYYFYYCILSITKFISLFSFFFVCIDLFLKPKLFKRMPCLASHDRIIPSSHFLYMKRR